MFKIKNLFKFLIIFIAIMTACALLGNAWFEHKASNIQENFQLEKASNNSIKHSYTASIVYSLVSKTGLNQEHAEILVVYLGILNELVEYPVKLGIFSDSGLEIVKDLHNNMVGIEVAKWLRGNKENLPSGNELSLIVNLAKHKILIFSEYDVSVKNMEEMKIKQFSNIFIAVNWFEENQKKISEKVNTHLDSNLLHN